MFNIFPRWLKRRETSFCIFQLVKIQKRQSRFVKKNLNCILVLSDVSKAGIIWSAFDVVSFSLCLIGNGCRSFKKSSFCFIFCLKVGLSVVYTSSFPDLSKHRNILHIFCFVCIYFVLQHLSICLLSVIHSFQ